MTASTMPQRRIVGSYAERRKILLSRAEAGDAQAAAAVRNADSQFEQRERLHARAAAGDEEAIQTLQRRKTLSNAARIRSVTSQKAKREAGDPEAIARYKRLKVKDTERTKARREKRDDGRSDDPPPYTEADAEVYSQRVAKGSLHEIARATNEEGDDTSSLIKAEATKARRGASFETSRNMTRRNAQPEIYSTRTQGGDRSIAGLVTPGASSTRHYPLMDLEGQFRERIERLAQEKIMMEERLEKIEIEEIAAEQQLAMLLDQRAKSPVMEGRDHRSIQW